MQNIFEQATRQKLRFSSVRGNISTEDLWDLSLEDLDAIAKALNKQKKDSSEESFIKKTSTTGKKVTLQLDVVVAVINAKMVDAEKKENAAQRKAKRAQLLQVLNDKQDESLKRKSVASLQAELDKLDGEEEGE